MGQDTMLKLEPVYKVGDMTGYNGISMDFFIDEIVG